jgi:hypothetical protein
MGDNIAWEGVGDAVHNQCITFFFDDGLVSARCPVWLQSSFDILTQLFERIGLLANADKMKVMICVPGKIQAALMEEEYANQQAGNTTITKCCRVICDVCGASLAAESLRSRLETQHDVFWSFVLNQDIAIARPAEVYRAIEVPNTGIYCCPVPLCPGILSTRFNLRQHFLMQHPQDLVCIPAKGSQPLLKCKQCGLQMPVEDLNGGHHCTELCQRGWKRRCQHAAATHSQHTLNHVFTCNGDKLARVEVFKYLGWLIA